MYQQKKDLIKSNKTNQVKMWQNLEKALGAQADQEENEYLHRNSNEIDSANTGKSYYQEF